MRILFNILWLSLILISCSQGKKDVPDLAIHQITLIDATGGKPQPDMTVLITGDTISGIVPSRRMKFGASTKIIDSKGKFLIPGLWDMHVHGSADSIFSLLTIANGITSVREMFNTTESFRYYEDWSNKINEKKILGPDIYIPLAAFGPDQNWFGGKIIKSKQEAIDFVNEAKSLHADFIKIFDLYDPEIILALLKEVDKTLKLTTYRQSKLTTARRSF